MNKIVLSFVVTVALASGCAKDGFARFGALPSPDRDAFERCTDGLHGHPPYHARAKTCSAYNALSDEFQPCWGKMKGEYADQSGDEAKKKWLVDGGCPAEVVAGTSK